MLDTILVTLALMLSLATAPLFWWLSERNQLPNGVRYAGALISVAALHFAASCAWPSARMLLVSTTLHLIAAGAILLASLAPLQTRQFLRATIQVLFMKRQKLPKS